MNKRKTIYIVGTICILAAIAISIILIFNMGSSTVIRDKITSSDTSQKELTADEAEQYGVSPTENYKFGLYTSKVELDRQITVTMNVITIKHTDEPEEIMKVTFDVSPDNIKGYEIKTDVYSKSISSSDNGRDDVVCVGNITVCDDNGEVFSEHVTYTGKSVMR